MLCVRCVVTGQKFCHMFSATALLQLNLGITRITLVITRSKSGMVYVVHLGF